MFIKRAITKSSELRKHRAGSTRKALTHLFVRCKQLFSMKSQPVSDWALLFGGVLSGVVSLLLQNFLSPGAWMINVLGLWSIFLSFWQTLLPVLLKVIVNLTGLLLVVRSCETWQWYLALLTWDKPHQAVNPASCPSTRFLKTPAPPP